MVCSLVHCAPRIAASASEPRDRTPHGQAHYFPWAYADACLHILAAGAAADPPGQAGCDLPGGAGACAFRNCYLPEGLSSGFGGPPRLGPGDWEDLRAPAEEVAGLLLAAQAARAAGHPLERARRLREYDEAFNGSAAAAAYAEHGELACWVGGHLSPFPRHRSPSHFSSLSLSLLPFPLPLPHHSPPPPTLSHIHPPAPILFISLLAFFDLGRERERGRERGRERDRESEIDR